MLAAPTGRSPEYRGCTSVFGKRFGGLDATFSPAVDCPIDNRLIHMGTVWHDYCRNHRWDWSTFLLSSSSISVIGEAEPKGICANCRRSRLIAFLTSSGINFVHFQELHKYPEEHPSLPTSDPLPTPGLSREIINGADTEPNNLGLEDNEGNVFPEPVVQSSTSPTAGDNDGPATGDIDPGSDIAIGNIPEVGSPPHPLVSALRSRRKVSDSGGDTHTHDPSEDRQKRVEKRTRYLLQVLNESTMAEATENPPETVFIDQREENVVVSNGSVPYLTSKPIPNGKTLKKVVITIVSRYMESSSYNRNCGARSGGSMWFELSVGPSPGGSGERWRSEVARNLHARVGFQEYTIEISDRGLYEEAESGDVLTVWALAKSTWRTENRVKKVTIRCIVE